MSLVHLTNPFTLKSLPLVIALTAFATNSHAAFNISISDVNAGQNQPFQDFNISIQSDIELKLVEYNFYPEQFCSTLYLPNQPQLVSGSEFSEQLQLNYRQHQSNNGESICLYVEDQQGNKQTFTSADIVSLTPPKLSISQVSASETSHLAFKPSNEQDINSASFVFREENAGKVALFKINGQASTGTIVQLKSYNGIVIAHSPVDHHGTWSIADIAINLPVDSVNAGSGFNLTSVLASDTSVELTRQRLSILGKKVLIDLLVQPLDPIDESEHNSATLTWNLRSPLNISHRRVFMVDGAQHCPRNGPVYAEKSIELSSPQLNFFDHRDLLGSFACLQLEDEQGRLFNQAVGWVRAQPTPEIFVTDDISRELGYSDTFEAYVSDAKQVTVRYIPNPGLQSRDKIWKACQQDINDTVGININPAQHKVELSDPSLHDHYVCLSADNGFGGITHWMSENKLNLINGISTAQNQQQRNPSTPFPTALNIPLAMQGSTIANAGCRGVLLSDDVILTAAHCEAPFFHPTNGSWSLAPSDYSFLAAADEYNNQTADSMLSELYKRINNGHYLDFLADFKRINKEYSQYHSSPYHAWISPYFSAGSFAERTFSDFSFRRLSIPYSNSTGSVEYPQPLVYSYPSELYLAKGEFRSHGFHELTPHSGWRGGDIHLLASPGTNIVAYTLVETAGGESGSALWSYDKTLEEYGVIGTVRGGGSWSSIWNHGRATRQELAQSRARQLRTRRDTYQGNTFNYRDLRRAVASANVDLINTIISSGVNVNLDDHNRLDGWMLARAIDFAAQADAKLKRRVTDKHQTKLDQRISVIKALMLGGADPQLQVIKPTRYMAIEAGDSVLHYAVRGNNKAIFKALWLNTTNYTFESSARIQTNLAGETPLSIAATKNSEYAIIKMLFTDIGDDLQLNKQGNLLDQWVTADTISNTQVDIINWIAKAYLYEPVEVNSDAKISSDNWKKLLCHSVNYQGDNYSFNELAQLRRDSLGGRATAAIAALGNVSGIDASIYHCQR